MHVRHDLGVGRHFHAYDEGAGFLWLADDDGHCAAGNFVWRPAGSRHEAWAPDGCLVLGIFQVPNRFFEQGGRIADVLGQDWEPAWGNAGNLKAAG